MDGLNPGKYSGYIKPPAQDDKPEMQQLLYLPLANGVKGFRLLTILPSESYDNDLECLLDHADLGNPSAAATGSELKYETISYCWGDSKRQAIISVNGRRVLVPASSSAALRRMRLALQKRVVWLDVVCINQHDDLERGQQVSMMDDIYRNGMRNLIYLGEDNVDLALVSIETILDEVRDDPDAFKRMRNELGTWQYASTGINAEYDSAALIRFFAIPWFR